jgi:hypothetical protein
MADGIPPLLLESRRFSNAANKLNDSQGTSLRRLRVDCDHRCSFAPAGANALPDTARDNSKGYARLCSLLKTLQGFEKMNKKLVLRRIVTAAGRNGVRIFYRL